MSGSEGKGLPYEGSFGVIIARTTTTAERPMDALRMAKAIRSLGRKVGVFLVSDGVYIGKDGRTEGAYLLKELLDSGVQVLASPEHLNAAGLPREKMLPGIKVADETYRDLVTFVMEEYEKVIIC